MTISPPGRRSGRLMYLSGIDQVESLLRYVCYVPGAPKTKAQLRHVYKGRERPNADPGVLLGAFFTGP